MPGKYKRVLQVGWDLLKTTSNPFNSAPVGFSSKPGDCLFLSVPCEVKYLDAERSGCKL
jgi:hypothetical protein